MKGLLFSAIETVVLTDLSEDAWDEILDRAGSDGVYTSLGDYRDADFSAIVRSLATQLDISLAEALVLCGRRGFPVLADRHPEVVAPYQGWRALLADLNGIVHPEVGKVYAGARAPDFTVFGEGDGLRVEYRSDLGLCRLAEGFVLGAGDHFRTPVSVTHRRCTHDGAPCCELFVADAG